MNVGARKQFTAFMLFMIAMNFVSATENDCKPAFNETLQEILEEVDDPRFILILPTVPIKVPGVCDVQVRMRNITITGLKSMVAQECINNNETDIVNMSLFLPTLEIYIKILKMNGTVVENVILDGTGDGWFFLEQFTMSINGHTTTLDLISEPPIIVFDDLTLTLDLWRWTVDMRGLTPDSDLEQMMNSFLSMLGPDIFYAMGQYLTDSGIVLKWVNSLFPPDGTVTEPSTTTETGETGISSESTITTTETTESTTMVTETTESITTTA